jgi:hypothetical protein
VKKNEKEDRLASLYQMRGERLLWVRKGVALAKQ